MKRRKEKRAMKAKAKRQRMGNPGDESRYSKKRAYLNKHGGWGFDYIDKPWK